MKIIIILLAAIVGLAAAHPTSPKINQRAPNVCSTTVMSCPYTGGNTCCSPQNGLVALSLQWAPGFGPQDAFTIHGIFPDTCSGQFVSSCDFSDSYSIPEIRTFIDDSGLYDRMNTSWPSNKGEKNNYDFWLHEWQKHGTCISTLARSCDPSYDDGSGTNYIEYINTVLDLCDQYDIYGALSDDGIIPSDTERYDTERIRNAIKQNYPGAVAKLDCHGGALTDVTINFNVRGRDSYVINPNRISNKGSCHGHIYLPLKY